MSTPKHTPPWSICDIVKNQSNYPAYTVRNKEGKTVFDDTVYFATAPSKEDAAFIVKSANMHEELVEALDSLVRTINGVGDMSRYFGSELSEAKEILNRAKS